MKRFLVVLVIPAILMMATTVNATPYMGFPITVDFDFTNDGSAVNPASLAVEIATPRPDQPSIIPTANDTSFFNNGAECHSVACGVRGPSHQ